MKKLIFYPVLYCALAALSPAADQSPVEAKLREALKNTMLQNRALQTERDTLQAAKDQGEQERKDLTEKLDALTKQAAADRQSAEKLLAETRSKLADQELESARLRESLEKWKLSQQQAVELAAAKESARARLAAHAIDQDRRLADQQTRNDAMYKLAMEILSRYEKFGLGTAILAREPFTGTARVKLQSLVQDYGDKLQDQRIRP